MTVLVNQEKCLSCGGCVAVCPKLALEMKQGIEIIVYDDKCIDCSICVKFCPVSALELAKSIKTR